MKWVTRERPKIDRIACPWLIARFIDKPALAQLAAIVRGADTGRFELTPQSAGLHAVSVGLARLYADDHELLRHGLTLYEALYAWCEVQGR